MTDLRLLSNGTLHDVVSDDGSGSTRWKSIAVTRWREDAALGSGGTRLFLRDDASGALAPLVFPVMALAERTPHEHSAGSAVFRGTLLGLEATLTIAIDADHDVELRRLDIVNRGSVARTLSAAAMSEVALAPAAADSAHPAFNKLFVETRRSNVADAVIATRRPSKPEDVRCWAFHRASSDGAAISFETERARFTGRGGSLEAPEALMSGEAFSGTVGPVLDAVLASRVTCRIEAGAACTIDWFTGIADTSDGCEALIAATAESGSAQRLLEGAGGWRQLLRQRLAASASEAAVFERLAGALLVADPRLRATPAEVAANRLGQSGLWRFGISGDVPIVMLDVGSAAQAGIARQLVRAQAFWKAHGLASELLISCPAALVEPLTGAIRDSVGADSIDHAGGVFVRDAAMLADAERDLLRSTARIVIGSDVVSLDAWLEGKLAAPNPAATPPLAAASLFNARAPAPLGEATKPAPTELVAFNGHGGFTPDLREYVIVARRDAPTPAPWCNVLANPEFGTLVTESGSASTWSGNAHEFRLTPWSNDPIGDPNSEAIYLKDEDSGRVWSPTLQPAGGSADYVTRHGFGYSRFEHEEDGVASALEVFVALDLPVKFQVLTLANRSGRPRRLGVTGIVEWVLGDERAKNLLHIVTERDEASGAVLARNDYNTDYPGRTAFFALSDADAAACGDRVDFFGAGGTRALPAALGQPALSGRLGAALDPCAALRSGLTLAPGESATRILLLGAGSSRDDACSLVARCLDEGAADAALTAVRAYWQRTLGTLQVTSGEPAIDAMANGWLLYQTIASRLWGRTAFYQSSGAYGFRDQLQDVMALVHCAPGLVREHLLRAAARQFPEGDVQHWWHPPTGKGIRTRCSDDYLWLPFAAARYVEASADAAVLDEAVPFLEAALLKDGEVSSYSQPKVSAESASLYAHCVRAIRRGLRFGAHGLPLMGGGDWNDGMDLVGAEGRGESVWLAFFFVAVLKRFAPVAREHGDADFAATCEREAAALTGRIEASAWDGDWYLRAWFDDGTPLGTAAGRECRIDSIAQSWSVLSGAASAERGRKAMDAVHEHLVRTDMRLIELLAPPFDASTPSPGYIAGYVPGVRENGGQYTHGATWTALAYAALGDAERAWEAFAILNPCNHGSSAEAIATYKVEPYVVAGDVYSTPMHAGRGGWTWYTGSAGWMAQLLTEALLGFDRRGDRLRMRPLLPRGHAGFTMRYRHGKTDYVIAVRPADTPADATLLLDGSPIDDGVVLLRDDGVSHAVTVRV